MSGRNFDIFVRQNSAVLRETVWLKSDSGCVFFYCIWYLIVNMDKQALFPFIFCVFWLQMPVFTSLHAEASLLTVLLTDAFESFIAKTVWRRAGRRDSRLFHQ